MRPPRPNQPPPPVRKGLPLWVWVILVMGVGLGFLGLLLTVLPLVLLFWVMGSGHQYDTQAVVSPDSSAVLWMEVDMDDPGVADFVSHAVTVYPDMMARVRRAQGYPAVLNQLKSMRDAHNLQAGVPSLIPTQVAIAFEPDPDDLELAVLVAFNLPSWGRGIRLLMRFASWTQAKLAEGDPEIRPMQLLEVGSHTLYTQPGRGDDFFWGAMDGTTLFGSGSYDLMVDAMQRIDEESPPELHADLSAALDELGQSAFELTGAMRYQAPVVDKVWPEPVVIDGLSDSEMEELKAVIEQGGGAIPGFEDAVAEQLDEAQQPRERNCLAELDPDTHRSLAFGVDVVSADELTGQAVVLLTEPTHADLVERCLLDSCEGYVERLAEDGLELVCSVERAGSAVRGTARLTGIEAAMERWVRELEEEMQTHHAAVDSGSSVTAPPATFDDLPELEGVEF